MKPLAHLLLAALLAATAVAGEPPLSLTEAVALAAQRSKGAQLARLKTEDAGFAATGARLQRYPHITAFGLAGYYFRPLDLQLKQGALTPMFDELGISMGLGPLSARGGPFPSSDFSLARGSHGQFTGGLMILQPLTQQWRIDSGLRAAEADRVTAQRESAQTLGRIRLGVEELFVGILLEEQRRVAFAARVTAEERRLREVEDAVSVGEALDEATLGLRTALLQARTDLTRSGQQRARLALQLADLIGRPGDESLALTPTLPERAAQTLTHWVARAAQNPDRLIAAAIVEKAAAGVRAARQRHIPDLSAFATGFAQDGLPLAPATGGMAGLTLTWDVFDFGRRNSEIARNRTQLRAAELDRDRREEDAAREIRITFQDFQHAGELIALAEQAAGYRRRTAELARQSATNDLALESKALGAEAELRKAEADVFAARMQRHVALLRLHFLAGEL